MDLVASCRDKLTHFRIRDLKDVLTQLAVTKQGKKQDLINRILSLLSDDQATRFLAGGKRSSVGKEGIAKIIEDTYRKIHFSGTTDLASKSHNLDSCNVKHKVEDDDICRVDTKVRCPCGRSLVTESMVQCMDSMCLVWQHVNCVVAPENPGEYTQPGVPDPFYCEMCRIKRADPFWMTQTHPLLPLKLPCTSIAQDGTNTILATERTFQLSRGDRDLLQKAEYELQVWCILLNDKVPFRIQWPQFSELHVNGVHVRTTNRPGSQLLGANGRDDGPIVKRWSQDGINRISLSKNDPRVFCFGIRIARRRTVQQVMSLIPKETIGERFEDALARVRRCVGGGTAMENADSDSDIEVVAESVVVNLRCPMSGARIKTAGRFKPCVHMGCFDLAAFVELNQRSRKWQCPICLRNYSLENVIVDPYFNRVAKMLKDYDEDVDEIDIKPDGSWRINSDQHKDLGAWYLPDGSRYISTSVVKSVPEFAKQPKQDVSNEQKKDPNGVWENNNGALVKPPIMLGDLAPQEFVGHHQQTAFMSNSGTGSYREGEDSGINQEVGALFDFPTAYMSTFDVCSNGMALPGPTEKDVILLSDSEEDNATLSTSEPAYDNRQVDTMAVSFSGVEPLIAGTYAGAPGVGASAAPFIMETIGNGDEFGALFFPSSTCNQVDLSTCPQSGPFEFLSADTNAETGNNLTDAEQNGFGWPSQNGLMPVIDDGGANTSQMGDLLFHHPNLEDSGVLFDNPLAFENADPSLQLFFPTQPSRAPAERNLNMQEGIPDTFEADDWISLRLGDPGFCNRECAPSGDLDSGLQSRKHFLADTAGSLHLGMNDHGTSNKRVANHRRADDLSRSVKPRLSLSMDINLD